MLAVFVGSDYEQKKLAAAWEDLPPARYGHSASCVTAHRRVKRMWGSASQYTCIGCGGRACQWAYDGTDPTQTFGPVKNRGGEVWMFWSSYPEFYMPMCSGCHTRRDGAIAKQELREYRDWRTRTGLALSDIEPVVQELRSRSAGCGETS